MVGKKTSRIDPGCFDAYKLPSLSTEDFLQHYHKRSNVESVFSSIKRKFGDNVRSRSDMAKVNEALAKLVCNNLCAVIMSQCELGIEPIFWHNNAAELEDRPDILRLVRPG
jgi:hypothetical protein